MDTVNQHPARAQDPHHGHQTPSSQAPSDKGDNMKRVEEDFKAALLDRLPDSAKASLRAQGGPGAGLSFTTCPTCLVTRLEPHLFRILLLRRLRVPLPFTVRSCRCGSHLTPVATTAQRARRPGCLADVGGPWRVWQPESVEKPEAV